MRLFYHWFNHPPDALDGLLLAGLSHAWFEIIHLSKTVTGVSGRAVLDMALAQDEHRSTRFYMHVRAFHGCA